MRTMTTILIGGHTTMAPGGGMEEAVDGEVGHTVVEGIIGMDLMEDMEEGVIMDLMVAVVVEEWAEEVDIDNHARIMF